MNLIKTVDCIYRLIGKLFRIIGFQNVIILEMEQGTRENTYAVFSEMLRRGWDKRYQIVLLSQAPEAIDHLQSKHVTIKKYVQYGDNSFKLMSNRLLFVRARLIIDENKQIKKKNPGTIHIFLSHGSPIKNTREFYNCSPDTDYALCQSEFWRPIESAGLNLPEERFVINGLPRNDALFTSDVSMTSLFGDQHKKVVVWYPTYRQHKDKSNVRETESSSLPIIHNAAAAKKISEIAARYGVLIVVKPHPAQDLSLIKALNLDHLKLIYDDFFVQHGITPYMFLGKTDALITDYSSVIFDYLLTGKPIALAQEDYEEYEKKVGFAIDMNLLRSCAVQLETAEDFEPFIRDLVEGNDPLREKRDELMHLTNQYTDGHSTERVVDWLETLLKN